MRAGIFADLDEAARFRPGRLYGRAPALAGEGGGACRGAAGDQAGAGLHPNTSKLDHAYHVSLLDPDVAYRKAAWTFGAGGAERGAG